MVEVQVSVRVGDKITWKSADGSRDHKDHVVSIGDGVVYTTGRTFVSKDRILKVDRIDEKLYPEAKPLL